MCILTCSILPPNTAYTTIAIENCIITEGYYLSSYTLINTLYSFIHSVILGTSMTMPDDILLGLYIWQLVHYFYISYVVNNLLDNGKKDMFCGLMWAYQIKSINNDNYHHSSSISLTKTVLWWRTLLIMPRPSLLFWQWWFMWMFSTNALIFPSLTIFYQRNIRNKRNLMLMSSLYLKDSTIAIAGALHLTFCFGSSTIIVFWNQQRSPITHIPNFSNHL